MSEGAYSEAQVLPCGCVGVCECFDEPFRGEGLWYTQDANGYQYLWTGSAWVDPYSAEGQSVLADPSSYAAGVMAESGGYWYTQDASGYQYLWTASGWVPTTATAETDPSVAVIGGTSSGVSDGGVDSTTPASTVVGPPTAGDSVNNLVTQAIASGDPTAIAAAQQIQESQENMNEIWLNPGGEPDKPVGEDIDQDSIVDGSDYDPYDSSVQDPIDVPSDSDY